MYTAKFSVKSTYLTKNTIHSLKKLKRTHKFFKIILLRYQNLDILYLEELRLMPTSYNLYSTHTRDYKQNMDFVINY